MLRLRHGALATLGLVALAGCGSTAPTATTGTSAFYTAPGDTQPTPAALPDPKRARGRHQHHKAHPVSHPRVPLKQTPPKVPVAPRPTYTLAAIQHATYQLANIDGGDGSNQSALIADFQGLSGKCREAPERLAGEIWASERDLHRHGIQQDAEDVANHLAQVGGALGADEIPTNCAALLGAYLVLKEP